MSSGKIVADMIGAAEARPEEFGVVPA